MRWARLCLTLLLACGAPPAPKAAPKHAAEPATPDVDPSVPADLRATIARVQRAGRLMALLDHAAAEATDVAGAKGARTDVIGYLASPRRVVFPRGGGDATGEKLDPPEPAGALEEKLFAARQLALSKVDRSAHRYEPVVIPGPVVDAEGILVYLLSPSSTFLASTSDDGTHVLELAPLASNATPVETDVYKSLEHGAPVIVDTARGRWKVDGARSVFSGSPR